MITDKKDNIYIDDVDDGDGKSPLKRTGTRRSGRLRRSSGVEKQTEDATNQGDKQA